MRVFPPMLLLAMFAAAPALHAAERKPMDQVDTDKLTNETQRSAEPTQGMNLVWWIPAEFWHASLAQDPTMTAEQRADAMKGLSRYFVVAVVRADINSFGAFTFHDEAAVRQGMTVVYSDPAGRRHTFTPIAEDQVDPVTMVILGAIRPMLKAAMGNMGENFHFFVYDNQNPQAQLICSPYEHGALEVELAQTPGEAGGTIRYPLPLDSLYFPRPCSKCQHAAHITWQFCPMCGAALPE